MTPGIPLPTNPPSSLPTYFPTSLAIPWDIPQVMLDEIGKGTSARDGAAISGALLETLARRKVTGVFATHLYVQADRQMHACMAV